MKVIVASLLVLVIAHGCSAYHLPWWKKMLGFDDSHLPSVCKGWSNCPNFTITEKLNGYELRDYESSTWVTSEMPLSEPFWEERSNVSTVFDKLKSYIMGNNTRNMTMESSVPVITGHEEGRVILGVMIPKNMSLSYPIALDSSLSVIRVPKTKYYVKSFNGWPYGLFGYGNKFNETYIELKKELDRDGKYYDDEKFYTAKYDGLWGLYPHYEVWVEKTSMFDW